jgi:outer membrane protein assembly factor BamA
MDNSNSGQRKKIKVYDTKIKTLATSNKKINVNKHFDTLTHEYSYGRFEYNTFMPVILPGYNPDDGLLLGGGISFKKQKWGHFPFKQHHYLAANYAFRTSAYNFFYEGIFTRAIGRWNVRLNMQLNQPDYVVNFYGLGNNAMLTTKDRSYNRVRVNQFDLDAGIERTFKSRHKVQMRGNFLTTRVESTKGRFVSPGNPVFDSSDFDRTNWVGGTIGYTYESINNVQFPTKGLRLSANVHYLYSHQQSNYFLNNESAISAFIPIGKMVFATRIGGGWLAGEPQFFQYNQLGGLTNLRGFRRSRFSGKSIVYNNNELRLPVANLHGYILRGKLGVSLFSDNGRVWIPNERSDKWHIGYGGSIWVIPYQRMAFTANFGISDEDKIVTVKAGFLF